jgi:hypothetical protein
LTGLNDLIHGHIKFRQFCISGFVLGPKHLKEGTVIELSGISD